MSGHPELTRHLKPLQDTCIPTFFNCQVKQVCTQTNAKYKLNLKDNDLHNCAVDIFSEVGRKLQKRRVKDFRATSGSVLTDDVKPEHDPALKDVELKQKLKSNKKVGWAGLGTPFHCIVSKMSLRGC